MKRNKLFSRAITCLILLGSSLLASSSVSAGTTSYTFNANWTESTCTGTINGSTGIISYHVTQGETVNTKLVNQSTSDLNVVYAKSGGDGSFYKFVKAGASDSESFTNVQGNISVTPSANGSGCGTPGYQYSGPGPASASITADPPATTTTPATPKSTSSSTTKTTTPATTPAPGSDSSASTAANPVQLTSVLVAGNQVPLDSPIELSQSQELGLAGHTTANGVVNLTIHSTPQTDTTTANANGDWSYTVNGLEPGEHYIEASVTDPTTKQTSATATLVSFTVNSQPAAATPANKNNRSLVGLLILALLVAAIVALILAKKGRLWPARNKKLSTKSNDIDAIEDNALSAELSNDESEDK